LVSRVPKHDSTERVKHNPRITVKQKGLSGSPYSYSLRQYTSKEIGSVIGTPTFALIETLTTRMKFKTLQFLDLTSCVDWNHSSDTSRKLALL